MEKDDLESFKKIKLPLFSTLFYRITARATLTMNEPDKDTAIEVTPETQPKQVRVPKIVAEINGVASCVRERNKNKDHDAEVLENVAPTQAKKTMEITRIIRENTHPRHSSANGCLRSLCFVGLLIALIYVCLILHDVRRFLGNNSESFSNRLRSLDDTLTNLSGNLTTSVGDLEAIVVNISDSVSNVTQVDNFIQETFLSLTGDLTLEEALASLGDKLVRNVKWKKLGDTLASDIQWKKVLSNLGNGLTKNVKWKKVGDILGEEIQWEKMVTVFGKALVEKMDLDNLSQKDESTAVRYLNTRGPGCTEGTCSGWLV